MVIDKYIFESVVKKVHSYWLVKMEQYPCLLY